MRLRKHRPLWFGIGLVMTLGYGCGRSSERTEPKNIFGTDDRVELDVTAFPGKAVGRLDGGCSGAMIGKRLALTAAHCVYDKDKGALRSDVKYFKAGFKKNEEVAKSWISSVWIGSKTPEDDRKNDWALLLLADPIGDKTGWFGIRSESSLSFPMTVYAAGYASDKDRGEVPQVDKGCYVHKRDDKDRLLHDCDGVTGISGGPLYSPNANDSGADIVAITVAEFRTGDQSMTRTSYSHDYANIAVGVSSFKGAFETLKPASDTGSTTPNVSGAFALVNQNSSEEQPNNDQNGGTPAQNGGGGPAQNGGGAPAQNGGGAPGQNGAGADQAAVRAALEQALFNRSLSLYNDSQTILNAASAIADYSNNFGMRVLFDNINPIFDPASRLSDQANQMYWGMMQRSAAADGILASGPKAVDAVNNFSTYFDATYGVNTRVAVDLRYAIYDLKNAAARVAANLTVN